MNKNYAAKKIIKDKKKLLLLKPYTLNNYSKISTEWVIVENDFHGSKKKTVSAESWVKHMSPNNSFFFNQPNTVKGKTEL
jgi:hypothetical protein